MIFQDLNKQDYNIKIIYGSNCKWKPDILLQKRTKPTVTVLKDNSNSIKVKLYLLLYIIPSRYIVF